MTAPPPIYLDNAATTRPLEEVVERMGQAHLEWFGNPSSGHDYALAPHKALSDAREYLRGTLSAAEVVFTSGGTEADLLGVVGAVQHRSPGRVLCAVTDHPAILMQRSLLATTRHKLTPLPVTQDGDIDPELLFENLGRDVRAIALLHGHNELGTLSELEELVSLSRRVCPDAHIHVDLVQSYGKIPFDLNAADVDSIAVSGHKLHGPRGIGLLALSSKADIRALQAGGGQEDGLRGGTENVAGAVGLAIAAEAAFTHLASTHTHCETLASQLFARILQAFPNAERLGNPRHRLPHILSLRIPGIVGATMLERMNAHSVAFSTGSACHDEGEDNPVLTGIGMNRRTAREVMRFSFSKFNTAAEIDRVATLLEQEAQSLLAQAPKTGSGAKNNPDAKVKQK
ncbi:MAG: cysteine desulfurase family protein [Planctomycetota bacterium]|nr:cysteine desulfurase family protein [Planctomycetota bacterium]